jgi:L-histidine N-alpha-methyltransferase
MKPPQREILSGLQADQKYLPSKFFYDKKGSQLFEQITRLEEYYPSRTEKTILKRHAPELMQGVEGVSLVELGSGDCSKVSILLDALPEETRQTVTYVPVDVSTSALEESQCILQERYDGVEVQGVVADFTQQIDLVSQYESKLVCFLGSTIGNLESREATRFISRLGDMLRPRERFLLGLDMVKDKNVLERAYNDAEDLTAEFNKNILKVANKIAKTDFEPEHFEHQAFFDEEKQRIEMHLVATRDITVQTPLLDRDLEIQEGESIHTESSHKFSEDHIEKFASASDLSVREVYTDSNRWFALVDYIK